MYFLNLTQVLGTGTLPDMCVNTSQVDLEMFLCASQEPSKSILLHGALIETEILTCPLPNVFAQLRPCFWVPALYLQVGQHLPQWSTNIPMCLTNFYKIFGAWGPNRS